MRWPICAIRCAVFPDAMGTTALLNLTIEVTGIVLCLLGLLHVAISTWLTAQTRRYFKLFFLCLNLFILATAAGQLMRGRPGGGWRAALYAANFLEYIFSFGVAVIFSRYLVATVDPRGRNRAVRRFIWILCGVHVLLLIVSQFTGLFYVIDAQNIYRRSRWYPLVYLTVGLILLMDVALLIGHHRSLSRRERAAFWIYLIVPVAAIVAQLFVYGISFGILAMVVAALVVDVFILSEQAERQLAQEKELSEMRVKVLLAQIRPHFIFNTLTSIYVLIRDDPPRAMEVLQDFTAYLQSNFSGIAAREPISFTDELRHTQAYLAVEAIRYGDRLQVRYDTAHTAFRLPALTLQPLVENAVKHGVRNTRSPVHITISSRAEGADAVLTVTDDGPGFDPSALEQGDRVGLRNVRERLRETCGGTLELSSAPGEGTAVTVRIPSRNRPGKPGF